MKSLQYTMPITKMWSPELVRRNLQMLNSQIRWKGFKSLLDEATFEVKGYFVISFWHGIPQTRITIHIWRTKVEITSRDWRSILIGLVLLSVLLGEEKQNIFLDNLQEELKEKGQINRNFHELCLDIMVSQYLDLVEGKVEDRLVENTRESIRLYLTSMLQAIGKT